MSDRTRIIGIDYGLARIGIAYTDESKIIAMPMTTVTTEKTSDNTVKKILKTLDTHQQDHGYTIEEIVVGMPFLLSGKVGLLADEVKHFIHLLEQHTSIPIKTWDERLTSVQAERSLKESKMSRKKRSRVVDKVAAVLILQSYLETRN